MAGLLDGKVAFVTGGAQGIGRAIARRFARSGCAVVIGDVNAAAVEATAAEIDDEGASALGVTMDVTEEGSTRKALDACVQRFGRVDVVVANAGVLHLEHVLDMDEKSWRRVIDVNLTGAFLTCKHFGQRLVDQGDGGRIILTSSLFGRRGGVENGAYSASKFGMIGLMESLAAELGPFNIAVNAVCPGQIDTEMMRGLIRERSALTGKAPEEVERDLVGRVAFGRLASADEVADAFVYLASDLSSYTTGQSIVVDGGWSVG